MSGLFKFPRLAAKPRRRRKKAAPLASVMKLAFDLMVPKPARGSNAAASGARTKAKTRPGTAAKIGTTSRRSPVRGTSFKTATHVCEHGQRRYKIFTPAGNPAPPKPLPLLIMLHGCGQTPDDFAKDTRMNAVAQEFGVMVVYPAQPCKADMHRCWNWFRPGDQARAAGEPALIASLTRHVLEHHGADPARVYIAGLSAGASMALVVADAYPDLFAAVGAHSGLPVGAASNKAAAVVAMQQGNPGRRRSVPVPTIIFHGSADAVIIPRNGRLIALRALEPYAGLRQTETRGRVANGRTYVKTVHRVGKGRPYVEHWSVTDSGHAWSGGSAAGRFTDPLGPDASAAMLRFFLRHRITARRRTGLPPIGDPAGIPMQA